MVATAIKEGARGLGHRQRRGRNPWVCELGCAQILPATNSLMSKVRAARPAHSGWCHHSGRRAPFLRSEGGEKETKVSQALCWLCYGMHLIVPCPSPGQAVLVSICSMCSLFPFPSFPWIKHFLSLPVHLHIDLSAMPLF